MVSPLLTSENPEQMSQISTLTWKNEALFWAQLRTERKSLAMLSPFPVSQEKQNGPLEIASGILFVVSVVVLNLDRLQQLFEILFTHS